MTELSDYEQAIHDAHDAGRMDVAATATLSAYGHEIRSFIGSRIRTPSDADEAYSMFVEDLWAGLPKFTWRCSMRTWAYLLARNASTRFATQPQRRSGRNLPLSWPGALSELVEQVRSATRAYQKTDVKDRFRALREQLAPDDQTLLTLRVDRQMSYRDLAILTSGTPDWDEEAIARESVRLRQVMARVRRELRRLGESEGLLKAKSGDAEGHGGHE
jgi:RNA polymerase sigma-70 factor (ECF subfamily)